MTPVEYGLIGILISICSAISGNVIGKRNKVSECQCDERRENVIDLIDARFESIHTEISGIKTLIVGLKS